MLRGSSFHPLSRSAPARLPASFPAVLPSTDSCAPHPLDPDRCWLWPKAGGVPQGIDRRDPQAVPEHFLPDRGGGG